MAKKNKKTKTKTKGSKKDKKVLSPWRIAELEKISKMGTRNNQLYFAFGSNLNQEQMADRCPGAVVYAGATLNRERLAFAGSSGAWSGKGVATIVADKDCSVPGLLYQISERDMYFLDGYEGHPISYVRERIVVEVNWGSCKFNAIAWTYRKEAEVAPPSVTYFNAIAAGYAELGDLITNDHVDILFDAADVPEPPKPKYDWRSKYGYGRGISDRMDLGAWGDSIDMYGEAQEDVDNTDPAKGGPWTPQAKLMDRPEVVLEQMHCEVPFMFADDVVEALILVDRDDDADEFQTDIIIRGIEYDLDAVVDAAMHYVDVVDATGMGLDLEEMHG